MYLQHVRKSYDEAIRGINKNSDAYILRNDFGYNGAQKQLRLELTKTKIELKKKEFQLKLAKKSKCKRRCCSEKSTNSLPSTSSFPSGTSTAATVSNPPAILSAEMPTGYPTQAFGHGFQFPPPLMPAQSIYGYRSDYSYSVPPVNTTPSSQSNYYHHGPLLDVDQPPPIASTPSQSTASSSHQTMAPYP